MSKKILIILSFFISCCASTVNSRNINRPPTKNFVKVYKELEITKCQKINKKCTTKIRYSIGSGLIVDIGTEEVVVLSAGHVCSSNEKLVFEDKKNTYRYVETVAVMNYQKKFFDAHVIYQTQATKNSADLCSLYIPDINQNEIERKIRMARVPPKAGEEIYYMGAPVGIYHPPTVLMVRGIFSGKIDNFSSLTSAQGAPGASGSVILSNKSEIYGVLWAVHPRFPVATIVTDYHQTYNFLLKTRILLGK